jgi:hypothetical protein
MDLMNEGLLILVSLGSSLLCLTGCMSPPKTVALAPIGPVSDQHPAAAGDGFLRIYSARERAVIDLNAEEFFWNNDFGRNEFLHATAHTDYAIYTADGKLLRRVRNARGMNDEEPATVPLAPGTYKIQASAVAYDAVTFEAVISVVIEPGQTTEARLDQPWKPSTPAKNSRRRAG